MPQPLPPHVQWLQANRGAGLQSMLDAGGWDLSVEAALHVLMAADPSPGLYAVDWLCNALVGGGMRWEDVVAGRASKAAQTLVRFAQHRAGLPPGQRNLEDYKSLGAVYAALAPLLPGQDVDGASPPNGRHLRRLERAQARSQSIMVHESSEIIVAVPTTKMAAQWWGRGTRWCTAAREDNAFDYYDRRGPLIVVVLPGVAGVALEPEGRADLQSKSIAGVKLQMHIDADGDTQFMDSADDDVGSDFVHQHWNLLAPLVLWAAARTGELYSLIPRGASGITPAMHMQAVRTSGMNLRNVANDLIDEEMCLAAVKDTHYALHHVPGRFCTPQFYMAAVKYSGRALDCVPLHMRTPELCRAAVVEEGVALYFVPEHLKTAELCWLAAQTVLVLSTVPQRLRTRELVEQALATNPHELEHLEDNDICPQDRELCLIAVKANGYALRHVHTHLIDTEMALAAVTCHGGALQNVSPRIGNAEIYKAAVEQDCMALNYVPRHCRTRALCMLAIAGNGNAIRYVPHHVRTELMWRTAVQKNPRLVAQSRVMDIPSWAVRMAITIDPDACSVVPELDQDMVVSCLADNPQLLAWVDESRVTAIMCLDAVRLDNTAVRHVPPEFRQSVLDALPGLSLEPKGLDEPHRDPEIALAGLARALEGAAQTREMAEGMRSVPMSPAGPVHG